jgi:hypothetical protein
MLDQRFGPGRYFTEAQQQECTRCSIAAWAEHFVLSANV